MLPRPCPLFSAIDAAVNSFRRATSNLGRRAGGDRGARDVTRRIATAAAGVGEVGREDSRAFLFLALVPSQPSLFFFLCFLSSKARRALPNWRARAAHSPPRHLAVSIPGPPLAAWLGNSGEEAMMRACAEGGDRLVFSTKNKQRQKKLKQGRRCSFFFLSVEHPLSALLASTLKKQNQLTCCQPPARLSWIAVSERESEEREKEKEGEREEQQKTRRLARRPSFFLGTASSRCSVFLASVLFGAFRSRENPNPLPIHLPRMAEEALAVLLTRATGAETGATRRAVCIVF